ncbi:HD-GYP domain-containing protein [Leadbettera azotonutricia]|uniref:Response regulator receiver modulated metal dependent phosphohydrolase n=1 Tax=Leadbettera azotonutricia (strain ATCC BAA-888 / DSM 13862 / ZAS-9) TaxID=545695 RepID=F5YDH4_LEAAZ|nr:response regulator [Leadbettera azotonutricia]AEF80476.1 response regulator receiver modulated metal dependent phosphohydrolase [Leadbettera azotonutricia ZAS-9]
MKSILVVDDNLASLKQIGAQLHGDYEVYLAKSGTMGLDIARKEKPDLILLDVEMSGMDGFRTIAKIREYPALRQIPVIFLTGNSDSATEIRALESGAVDFILKPANTDILYHRIELHLQFTAYQLHLEKMVKELEDNIGASFAELIECKDENIAGHVMRAGKYMELLGKEILDQGIVDQSFTFMDLTQMIRAVPFHDIGKMGISDTILLKKGTLTPEEYEEVKKHTLIGAEVLQNISERTPNQPYFKMAKLIAEGHHEWFNGEGYPYGLSGEGIPLCSRIMSVINVYDGCMTDRIYRPALSHAEACEVIINGSGTQFDPRIVDVFKSISSKFEKLGIELHAANKVETKGPLG